MVASALRSLGVYVGDKADDAVIEDVEIAGALERGDITDLDRLIADRNSRFDVWAFKRPAAYQYLSRYERRFRNLQYVVTFRDPLAIAMRNNISMFEDLVPSLTNATVALSDLVRSVAKLNRPALLLSYEKCVADPGALLDKLAEFAGIPLPAETKALAMNQISDNVEKYLQQSRLRYEGRIDQVTPRGVVRGWVRLIGSSRPIEVTLVVNGLPVKTILADQYRPDLERANKNGGRCAFEFESGGSYASASSIRVVTADGRFEIAAGVV